MGDEIVERSFLGKHRDKMWTYLILMALLLGIVIVINVVWKNPTRAEEGMKHFIHLPAWALATVAFLGGAIIFWLGLKELRSLMSDVVEWAMTLV